MIRLAYLILILLFSLPVLAGPHDAANHVREWRMENEQLIIDRFAELLRIPNVASDTANIRRNAIHISDMLQGSGYGSQLAGTRR